MWILMVLLCILTSAKTTKASLTNTVKRRQHLVNYAYVSRLSAVSPCAVRVGEAEAHSQDCLMTPQCYGVITLGGAGETALEDDANNNHSLG